jgi:hypothetical protein
MRSVTPPPRLPPQNSDEEDEDLDNNSQKGSDLGLFSNSIDRSDRYSKSSPKRNKLSEGKLSNKVFMAMQYYVSPINSSRRLSSPKKDGKLNNVWSHLDANNPSSSRSRGYSGSFAKVAGDRNQNGFNLNPMQVPSDIESPNDKKEPIHAPSFGINPYNTQYKPRTQPKLPEHSKLMVPQLQQHELANSQIQLPQDQNFLRSNPITGFPSYFGSPIQPGNEYNGQSHQMHSPQPDVSGKIDDMADKVSYGLGLSDAESNEADDAEQREINRRLKYINNSANRELSPSPGIKGHPDDNDLSRSFYSTIGFQDSQIMPPKTPKKIGNDSKNSEYYDLLQSRLNLDQDESVWNYIFETKTPEDKSFIQKNLNLNKEKKCESPLLTFHRATDLFISDLLKDKKKKLVDLKRLRLSDSPLGSKGSSATKQISGIKKGPTELNSLFDNLGSTGAEGILSYMDRTGEPEGISPHIKDIFSHSINGIFNKFNALSMINQAVADLATNFSNLEENHNMMRFLNDERRECTAYDFTMKKDSLVKNDICSVRQSKLFKSSFETLHCAQYFRLTNYGEKHPSSKNPLYMNCIPKTNYFDEGTKKVEGAQPFTQKILVAKFSHESYHLAAGCSDGNILLLQFDYGSKDRDFFQHKGIVLARGSDIDNSVVDLAWNTSSTKLLASYLDKRLILWNTNVEEMRVEGGRYMEPALLMLESPAIITSIEAQPLATDIFALGSLDKYIRIYNAEEDMISDWYQSNDYITTLTYSPDGRLLLVGFSHGVCRLYKVKPFLVYQCDVKCRNQNIKDMDSKKVINALFVGKDEFLVATADGNIRGFHCSNVEKRNIKYKGHESNGNLLRMDCDEQIVICPSENGEIFCWPRIKPSQGETGVFADKQERNDYYEVFQMPGPNRIRIPGSPTDKCKIALIAPPEVSRVYKAKLKEIEPLEVLTKVIITINTDGALAVLINTKKKDQNAPADPLSDDSFLYMDDN